MSGKTLSVQQYCFSAFMLFFPQAFCLPILQIVQETLLDQREGKGARKSAHSGGKFLGYADPF